MVSRKKDIKVNNPIEPKGHYSHYKKRTISICAQRPLLASSLVKSANFCFNLIHQTPHNTKITRFDRSPLTTKQREMSKVDEPVMGVPFYVVQNPYQAGAIPPNAVYGDPKGIPIQQTIYRDTPAPFNCVYCGNSGLTDVR